MSNLFEGMAKYLDKIKSIEEENEELKEQLAQAEKNQESAERDLEVLVNIVPQRYLDMAIEERFGGNEG